MTARGLICHTILLSALAAIQPAYAEAPVASAAGDATSKPDLWSFLPVRPVLPPAVVPAEHVESPVDAFILAKLNEHGLTFSETADKRTMLRRATFDLTGLPPTPDEMEAFL